MKCYNIWWINSHFPSATGRCKVYRAIIVTEGFHTHPPQTQARLAKLYQAKFLQIKAYRRENPHCGLHSRPGQIYFGKMPQTPQGNLG